MTAARRLSRWASWRADIRLARRQVWRTKGSSVLVVGLVALPVLGLVGAAIVAQSHIASPAQQAGFELGQNQAWLQIVGGADPSRWQYVDQPDDWTVERNNAGEPANDEGPAPTDVSTLLPAGTQTLKVIDSAQVRVETATGVGTIITTVGDVWRPEFTGRYTVISGVAPATADDAMVTPGLLTRLGATVGGTVTLPDASRSFTITGTLRRLDQQPSDQELFLPATAADVVKDPGFAKWFTPDWQPSFDQLTTLNREGVTAYARTLVLHPPSGAPVSPYAGVGSAQWAWLMAGAVIAAFSGYLVVLLAGAAFAVAARRQQRSLAMAASVGATRGDVFRVVVMQGTVLGVVGGVIGAALGAAGAGVFLAVTDRGVLSSFWGNWGYSVPWAAVVGVLLFATIVGTLAAIVPARTATHGDTVGALRGARRPAHLNPKRPLWGLLLMVAGFASTVAAGLALAGLNTAEVIDYENPWRTVALWAIVLSPIVFQVGVIVGGHWVLAMSSRLLSRLSLAARIASRDAAATPSRVIPAFGAIAACVFLASFALSMLSVSALQSDRGYGWAGPKGSVIVSIWAATPDAADAALTRAREVVASGSPARTATTWTQQEPPVDPGTGDLSDRDFPVIALGAHATAQCRSCGQPGLDSFVDLTVVSPEDLPIVLDATPDAATVAAYRAGAVLVPTPGIIPSGARLTFDTWTAQSMRDHYMTQSGRPASQKPARAVWFDPGHGVNDTAFISPKTAQSLGMKQIAYREIGTFATPATDAVVDRMTAAAETAPADSSLSVYREDGPPPVTPWLALIVAATGVLVIAASAVCLGLARFERRPDDATLTSVGAQRSVRRRINAWQAATLVGIGAVVGTVAGVIPIWGFGVSDVTSFPLDGIPWVWLAALAVGLPLMVTAVAWAVPPRAPDLTRRTAIA